MFVAERQNKILDIISREKSVKVSELSELLGISEVTVRKDLDELHRERKILRTHGGAMIFQHDNYHLPIQEIVMREAEAKQKIARKAYQFIRDNDVILLDDSTTVQELARLLAAGEQSDLTVVTGSLAVANLLLERPDIQLVLLGGAVQKSTRCALGPLAERMLADISIDKAFIGINGIHSEMGYSTSNFQEMSMKKAIQAASRLCFILADHTKFGQKSFLKVDDLNGNVNYLITDRRVRSFDYAELEKYTSLEVAEDEKQGEITSPS